MQLKTFLKAIEIISVNHSTRIYINKPHNGFVGELGSSKFTIDISDCCGAVINNLKENGFNLSMKNGLTSVDYFGSSLEKCGH